MTRQFIPVEDTFKKFRKNPEFMKEYESQAEEFALARALIDARVKSGLTQTEIAEKMQTTQSAIARLESMSRWPSLRTLHKYAKATGTKLKIAFE